MICSVVSIQGVPAQIPTLNEVITDGSHLSSCVCQCEVKLKFNQIA